MKHLAKKMKREFFIEVETDAVSDLHEMTGCCAFVQKQNFHSAQLKRL